jgi:hypothetical protein
MTTTRVAIGTILLASVAAFALPLTAEAFHGGGGGHIGGGGFHGGGMRFGGGHTGGMRMGRMGRFRSGGWSRHAFHGPHRMVNHTMVNHTLANRAPSHGTPSQGTQSQGHGPLATRMTSSFSHRDFMHGPFRRFGVFGWVGPLFWPYAFGDVYCSVFWGYWGYGCADPYWSVAYGDPFWGYGYGDIYGGLFSPFAFADLAPYLPNGPASVRYARSKSGTAPAEAIAQMCGDDTKEVAGWPIDRIQQLVSPDDRQRTLLDALADASVKAAQTIKSGCPTTVAFTPAGRLAAMESRIQAMQKAVETVQGPLDAFYGSLTEEQKAKFDAASQPPVPAQEKNGEKNEHQRAAGQGCATANVAAPWPEARIEEALRPNEAQQAKLRALQSAAAQAAEQLAAACPAELPATPPARLAAVSKRLDVMLTAVKSVRGALDDLYVALSDEQKAQFNQIGPSHTAARQS